MRPVYFAQRQLFFEREAGAIRIDNPNRIWDDGNYWESQLNPHHMKRSAAAAAAVIGGVLYFREETRILGYAIPHYVGLILTFCGILWFFYSLFADRQ